MKPIVKLCVDCKHHTEGRVLLIIPNHLCGHPKVCDPVTHKPLIHCTTMRALGSRCGERGKFFERAEPAPLRLLTKDRIAQQFGVLIGEARHDAE